MIIHAPISVGELLDKISILTIKSQHTSSEYVRKELHELIGIANQHKVYDNFYLSKLLNVNSKLWNIEDDLRVLERLQDFGETFTELARSVYITNDKRAAIKKEINEKYNSTYHETKIHK